MSCDVIKTCSSRESDTRIETIFFNETFVTLLNSVGDLHDAHAWSDEALSVLSGLTMHLCRTSQLHIVRLEELLFSSQLGTANSVSIALAIVLLDFTKWIIVTIKLLRDRNCVVQSLLPWARWPTTKQSKLRVVLLSCSKTDNGWKVASITPLVLVLLLFVSLFLGSRFGSSFTIGALGLLLSGCCSTVLSSCRLSFLLFLWILVLTEVICSGRSLLLLIALLLFLLASGGLSITSCGGGSGS